MVPLLGLSFAGSGFLGVYHLGAASALLRRGRRLLGAVDAYAGASAGALAAAVMVTAPHRIADCTEFSYKFAEEIRSQHLGALTPGFPFMQKLRVRGSNRDSLSKPPSQPSLGESEGIESILPSDAHERAEGRLHVSITSARTRRNRLVSHFSSRDELMQVLLASSFVPGYAGLSAVEYMGEKWYDGGFTDSLPHLPGGRTITVSPFSGKHDVCPHDPSTIELYATFAKQDIMVNLRNLRRANLALFPPAREELRAFYEQGASDATLFLQREGWHEEEGNDDGGGGGSLSQTTKPDH
ncbi:patatin-like phospholipase domain-containing protein 4 isoform X2 [Lethenteron reissneri]|nr:patatin-like phospholipase domain-containing protein 4 isoform X2 [Lethenteron reissneri]XP_061426173.1 patatin-like phospholipase domain-containing protein 4 isoform X2 [Lethenteron reissneri]XP_061426174.1 patatin-like phospholipase domain-containing protein 4 isoform X2 [Lethenteron reissneri]